MALQPFQCILTDIEGTTSSISFVTDELFPYFREHLGELAGMADQPVVKEALESTARLAALEDSEQLSSTDELLDKLHRWSVEDRKITPLKTLQGVLWDKGYRDGTLKGHVYADVPAKLESWKNAGKKMAVFSSGSVPAQRLIFGYSVAGDLTPYFSAYFDTNTGGKRDADTYGRIAAKLGFPPNEILFLSDVVEELEAARTAGCQTVQLVRGATIAGWDETAADFSQLP